MRETEECCKDNGKGEARTHADEPCISLNHKRAKTAKKEITKGIRHSISHLLSRCDRLLAEHFKHGFALGPVHLRERLLDKRTVFIAAVVEHLH